MVRRGSLALPEAFVERLTRILPGSRGRSVLATFARSRPTTLRVNTLKATPRDVRARLDEGGLQLDPVPWCREAFELRTGRDRDLRATGEYQRGEICVQGLSSLLPTLALAPQPGESVLDLAAAPGGKTTHIACLMQNRGRIVACDSAPIRFEKLKALVELQGATIAEVQHMRGEELCRGERERFDRVLVDAPCSSEARIQLGDPATWRRWSAERCHGFAKVQNQLLKSAFDALRPGGVLVYSTCTFAPEENEAVVHSTLQLSRGRLALERMNCPVANCIPGLVEWENARFDRALELAVRVLPTASMEGFFLARMRKRV